MTRQLKINWILLKRIQKLEKRVKEQNKVLKDLENAIKKT